MWLIKPIFGVPGLFNSSLTHDSAELIKLNLAIHLMNVFLNFRFRVDELVIGIRLVVSEALGVPADILLHVIEENVQILLSEDPLVIILTVCFFLLFKEIFINIRVFRGPKFFRLASSSDTFSLDLCMFIFKEFLGILVGKQFLVLDLGKEFFKLLFIEDICLIFGISVHFINLIFYCLANLLLCNFGIDLFFRFSLPFSLSGIALIFRTRMTKFVRLLTFTSLFIDLTFAIVATTLHFSIHSWCIVF